MKLKEQSIVSIVLYLSNGNHLTVHVVDIDYDQDQDQMME